MMVKSNMAAMQCGFHAHSNRYLVWSSYHAGGDVASFAPVSQHMQEMEWALAMCLLRSIYINFNSEVSE